MRRIGLDGVKAGKDKGEATDQDKRKRHAKRRKNSPNNAPYSQIRTPKMKRKSAALSLARFA